MAKVYLGLNVPEVRESGLPLLSTVVATLSIEEIREILSDPRRTAARVRFGGPRWVKNQGRRGSCQGYATAKGVERSRVKAGMPHVPLSGEYLYARCNGGRDQGSTLNEGMKQILTHGIAPESMVRHESYLWSEMSAEARAAAPRFKTEDAYAIEETPMGLATALIAGFECVVAVHVGGNYQTLDSRGVRGASNGPGNHAVGCCDVKLVGNTFLFDEIGSWGLNNGQGGFAWLDWDRTLAPTTRYHQFFAIRTPAADPQGENPPVVAV